MNITVESQFSTSGRDSKSLKDTYIKDSYNINDKTGYGAVRAQKVQRTGCILDIADKVMDNEAYSSHGLTKEDIMQQVGNVNVNARTDFMIVMSNCVSDEDFRKLQEEGFDAKATDVETYVSIVDEIKVKLAQSGVEIQGYNDDLDKEKVKEIVGNSANVNELVKSVADSIAEVFNKSDIPVTKENIEGLIAAFDEASKIADISDSAVKYMVQNKKAPTIDNLYKAQYVNSGQGALKQAKGYYSEGSGYYARKADDISWDSIDNQIEAIAKESGLAANERQLDKVIENAKWLVEAGIELNDENLTLVSDIKNIELPPDADKLLNMCATAISNGKAAKDTLLTGESSLSQEACRILNEIDSITDEAISNSVKNGEEINLKNLCESQKQIDIWKNNPDKKTLDKKSLDEENYYEPNKDSTSQTQLREIEVRRQLEETRLMMTQKAGRMLIKSGINVDLTELSKLVDELKQIEENIKAVLYKGDTAQENSIRAEIFEETILKTNELANMPVHFLGKVAPQISEHTISTLHEAGKNQNIEGANAVEKYETLMTAPRKDLGDKISKAFRNVDDILKDMGIETTSQNRRAVRILGYNSMEITKENIDSIKRADSLVTGVIEKMTPATTLKMIRENKNPLKMSLGELDKYLNEQQKDGKEDAGKYSEFLQKLDRSGKITNEEREAYIGIYRMFHQIEKSDGAVIGNLVASGARINFKNMLSAVRTRKSKSMDYQIDDEFGGLEKLITKGKAIDAQIETGFANNESDGQNTDSNQNQQEQTEYYARLSAQINSELAENTDVDRLKEITIEEETTIEKFADDIKTKRVSEKSRKQKINEELADMQKSSEKISAKANKASSVRPLSQTQDNSLQMLIEYEQPVSIDNVEAATLLMYDRGALFRQIINPKANDKLAPDSEDSDSEVSYNEEETKSFANRSVLDSSDRFIDSLLDKKTANAAYDEIINESNKAVEEIVYQKGNGYLDVKAAQALFKGLSLASNLAREENYEIPMDINGEITSVNLKIYHNNAKAGKVAVTMDTQVFGKVVCEFTVTQKSISGILVYDKKDNKSKIDELEKEVKQEIEKTVEGNARGNININMVHTSLLELDNFGADRYVSDEAVSTKELYMLAKAFIKALSQ